MGAIQKRLSDPNSHLIKEWDYEKNLGLNPKSISINSQQKVWWKCSKDSCHNWEASIQSRAYGTGCPYCSGRYASATNNLTITHPKLSQQWHPTKNGNHKPEQFLAGSYKYAWWVCSEGHEWFAQIRSKAQAKEANCPFCRNVKPHESNLLKNIHPELYKQIHLSKNKNLDTNTLTVGGHKKIWWKCPNGKDHEWLISVYSRVKGTGCPICQGLKVVESNCLFTTHPLLSQEWHQEKNKLLTPQDVQYKSEKKVWWQCKLDSSHIWRASINNRSKMSGTGCPYCSNKKVSKTNNLQAVNPDLAREWHPTKNNTLTPDQVLPMTNKKYWWICPKGSDHEWLAAPNWRHRNKCPFCSNQRVSNTNNLQVVFPELAKEWHPSKNSDLLPKDVIAGSGKKVWWMCSKESKHEWMATPDHRKKGRGCPFCLLKQQQLLYDVIKEFLPGYTVLWNHKHDGMRFSHSNAKMELDIFIPELKLAFEYQGEQHYFAIEGWISEENVNKIQKRDQEKRIKAEELGIQLIEVPYTWNGDRKEIEKILNSIQQIFGQMKK
jgi:hypothetical protein